MGLRHLDGDSDYGPSRLLAGSMLEERAWAERLYRDPQFVAAARNFRRWPVLGVRVWPNPPEAVRRTTYGDEVGALRS